jgi:hypothetical protein
MQLDFYLPVPLNAGCQIKVELPEQYSINTITLVQTKAVFGALTKFSDEAGNIEFDERDNSFLIRPCQTYIENDNVATIQIFSLMQPNYEKATDSVKINIDTEDGRSIAYIQ